MWKMIIEKFRQIDALILLLVCLILLFIGALFVAEKFFIEDTQIFQVLSGLLTGFSSAVLALLKPSPVTTAPAVHMDHVDHVDVPTATPAPTPAATPEVKP